MINKIFRQIFFTFGYRFHKNRTARKWGLTHSPGGICLPFAPRDRWSKIKSIYIILPDLSRLQKIILNHSGISTLNFSIFIFILLGIYTCIYVLKQRYAIHPSLPIATPLLWLIESGEGRRAASFTILPFHLHSLDFMKLEMRLTTEPAS